VATYMLRVTGVEIRRRPVCRAGHLHVVAVFRSGHLPASVLDTS
jgi:hypothetical protein